MQQLQKLAEQHDRDPASVDLVIFGSSGDQSTVEGHRAIGASRVVVGIEGGNVDHVRRQLDLHVMLLS